MLLLTAERIVFLALALPLVVRGEEVDARAEVAAALYAASATQAAAEKQADAKLKALRKNIDFKRALDIVESLQKAGRLAPADAWMANDLRKHSGK